MDSWKHPSRYGQTITISLFLIHIQNYEEERHVADSESSSIDLCTQRAKLVHKRDTHVDKNVKYWRILERNIQEAIMRGFVLFYKARFSQRSRIDIIACILKRSNHGSRKTRLIYKCNLSMAQFKRYAECLIEGGLLTKYSGESGAEIYETSEKGKKFLEDYGRIIKILEQTRLQPASQRI